jgi:serine protease Do
MARAQHRPLVQLIARWFAALLLLAVGISATKPADAQTQPGNSTPPTTANDRKSLLSDFSTSLDDLTQRVSPAVVQVDVTGFRALNDENTNDTSVVTLGHSIGSGVIVDSDGYIITNAHVVKGAQRIRVLLTTAPSGSQVTASLGLKDRLPPLEATVVGTAPTIDLALLKVDAKNLPVLPFADYNELRKGQVVLAFGNPEGFENSVSMGVVSAVARQVLPSVPYVYVQTDAPINPGNSGGPLVNTDGKIVGINTFILSQSGGNQGLGFAIPSNVVEFVYGQLRKYGHVHHIIIGADLQDITPDLAQGLGLSQQEGVIVSDVEPGGPAERGGLQVEDILEQMQGRSIGSVPLAEMIVATSRSDAVLEAKVNRQGKELTLEIPVKEDRSDFDQVADLSDPTKLLVKRLGIFGVTIDEKLAKELTNLRDPSGVIVAALAAGTLGVQTDLQQGDVIHSLNSKPINSLDDLRAGLSAIQPGTAGVLQIERDDKLMFITFEMD